MDDTTVAIASRLKAVSERQEVTLRQQKSVVVASTDIGQDWKATRTVSQLPSPLDPRQQGSSSTPMEQNESYERLDPEGGLTIDELRVAIYNGDHGTVTRLIDLPNINAYSPDRDGRTPLWMAAWRGHTNVVKLLLDRGAEGNGGDFSNALLAASITGHGGVVKLLLDIGANVNSRSAFYGNALQAASDRGHEEIVKLLLENGAEVNAHFASKLYRNALEGASRGSGKTTT
jgi:ankyrin repeat protein